MMTDMELVIVTVGVTVLVTAAWATVICFLTQPPPEEAKDLPRSPGSLRELRRLLQPSRDPRVSSVQEV